MPTPPQFGAALPEMDLIAQRIVKLAEVATMEHLEALLASQAGALLAQTAGLGVTAEAQHDRAYVYHRAGVSPSLGGTDA